MRGYKLKKKRFEIDLYPGIVYVYIFIRHYFLITLILQRNEFLFYGTCIEVLFPLICTMFSLWYKFSYAWYFLKRFMYLNRSTIRANFVNERRARSTPLIIPSRTKSLHFPTKKDRLTVFKIFSPTNRPNIGSWFNIFFWSNFENNFEWLEKKHFF